MTHPRAISGFSLVELLVAMAIVLTVAGAILQLTYPAQMAFQAEPERADMQQRLRIAVETISKDLMMAGAGGEQAGSSIVPGRTFAAIQPLRRGVRAPDPPGSFFDDRISVMYVPPAAAQTMLAQPTATTAVVAVAPRSGCPLSSPLCGFHANQLIVIYDSTGSYDTFRLLAVQNSPPVLVGDGAALAKTYEAGTTVARVEAATYWLKEDARADVQQLMHYDGQQTDAPVADNVSELRFEYFAEPEPPRIIRPLEDEHGPWTSYGPKPPVAGENCMFATDQVTTFARPEIVRLGSVGGGLVRLEASRLTDGPWCPDAASPARFDADLLRIRRVRVVLRIRPARTFIHTRLSDLALGFDVGVRNHGQ